VLVTPTATTACDIALAEQAHVAVFGPGVPVDAGIAFGEQLASARPPVAVVLMAPRVSTELLRQALRAGLRDVLSAEAHSPGDVVASVDAAFAAAASARGLAEAAVEAPDEVPVGQVVTVFSTKGGVGKSVLATNIAVALAADSQRRVVLVDLDLGSGDDGIMLDLQPAHTIADAVAAIDRLDTDMLQGLLVTHRSGLRALLAPVCPEDAEMITSAKLGRILDLVRQVADFVVIDTAGALDEVVLTAVDKSDVVLAVATMDMPSVKNMRVSLQKLSQLGYRNGLVRLVLNRADSKVLMEIADVEQALSTRVTARIPSDRLVPRSVNKGVPIVLEAPRSGVARSIVELAASVASDREVT
jgi:pilus assembly protein CpaE